MLFLNIVLFIIALIAIWFGAGLIVSATSKLSRKLKLSPFAFSFLFLGILTSIPEFSVGIQAVANNDAEIFVGNLLGGIVVLFLVIIPLLAVFGKGISLKHEFGTKVLLVTLGGILMPSFFVLDKKVTNLEGLILIICYAIVLYIAQRKNGIFNRENEKLLEAKAYSYLDILKILIGIILVFVSSNVIVDKTVYFGEVFSISEFYIGLLIIALGTNIPEISIATRSILSGKTEVAMGDYLGSASANTLLFGAFTLLNNGEVLTVNNFFITFLFIATALTLFFIFSVTSKYISRPYGLLLLIIYVAFVYFELLKR